MTHSTSDGLTSHPALRDHWYVVAESADVAPGPLPVRLLGEDLVLWRSPRGEVVAAPDRCPHREAPLSLGSVEGGCLVCPYHGWTFGHGGRCVAVPSAAPGVPVPPKAHLHAAATAERYGLVWVSLGTPRSTVPRIAQEDDPAFRRINSGVDTWTVSVTRMTDNFLDIAHFPYVHTGTFGAATNPQVPRFEIIQLDDDFAGYEYEVEVGNEAGRASSGLDAPVITRRMTTGFSLPFTVRSTIHYETGLNHIILLCSTPIDDVHSYFTFVVWRDDDHSVPGEEVITFDRAIGAEDKRMLERLPGVLPLDATATVSVQADRASVEWRRRLAAALA